ncbi:MAG: nucleoside triphosphate pyrophosphohydrolase [Thermoanaerobacteraceae bacterium]
MGNIFVVGLGPGDKGSLTLDTIDKITFADKVLLRTIKHPVVSYIENLGIKFESFDEFYNKYETFEEVYENIAWEIINIAKKYQNIVYAVPGNPFVAEKTVELLLNFSRSCSDIKIEVIPAMSFIDAIVNDLQIDPVHSIKIIDGLSLDKQQVDKRCSNIITQIYNRFVASDVKLKLMDIYGDDYIVTMIKSAGIKKDQRIEKLPLYMIDRLDWIDYLTSLYIPPVNGIIQDKYDIYDLLYIMEILRSEKGCPWDKAQNHKTLEKYLLEECYEAIEAIELNSDEKMIEELGDVLFQVVFHSQIAKERGTFDFNDVADTLCKKMIKRHPHIFAEENTKTPSEVSVEWDEIKKKEKRINNNTDNLRSVPKYMPALLRSLKVQERAAKVGFDWDKVEDAFAKVEEELGELKEVYKQENKDKIYEETGDLLFAVVNVARFLDVDPEIATHRTIEKFIKRFSYIEETATNNGIKMEEMSLNDMDKLWNDAKMYNFNKKNEK